MPAVNAPFVLKERLGQNGYVALKETVAQDRDEMVTMMTERFERRLAEECGTLRVEMAAQGAALRAELAQQTSALRGELAHQTAALRGELAQQVAALRADMAGGFAALRADLATRHSELMKWALLFWVGQAAAVAGTAAAVVRALR